MTPIPITATGTVCATTYADSPTYRLRWKRKFLIFRTLQQGWIRYWEEDGTQQFIWKDVTAT